MRKPEFSVIIPLYNKEPHIARAIQSALNQTYAASEILIVDDASTDGGLARAREFSDSRIRILYRTEPGAGGYAARNIAIREAKTEWVAFLDADDSWEPFFLQEIAEQISASPTDVGCAFTGYETAKAGEAPKQDIYSLQSGSANATLDFEGFLRIWLKTKECPIWTSASAFRRDTLIEAGLFPQNRCRRGGDKDTWLRALANAQAVSSPRVCATYHTDTVNQVTKSTSVNTRHCLCATLENMIATASEPRRTLLKRLFNNEVFGYAWRTGLRERLSKDVYRGFFASLDPMRYVMLCFLHYTPAPLQRTLQPFLQRGLHFVRDLRGVVKVKQRRMRQI